MSICYVMSLLLVFMCVYSPIYHVIFYLPTLPVTPYFIAYSNVRYNSVYSGLYPLISNDLNGQGVECPV